MGSQRDSKGRFADCVPVETARSVTQGVGRSGQWSKQSRLAQNAAPFACCIVPGCAFTTDSASGMCAACRWAGVKLREPIAVTDPMPESWRHVGRERTALASMLPAGDSLDVRARVYAPSPSAFVLREVDAVGCDSGEVSRRAETTADFLTAVTLLAIVAGIGIAVHFLMSGGQ